MAKKKKELSKKQKRTLENVRKNRQIDSNKLRLLIVEKKKWAESEKKRGLEQIQKIQVELLKIEGILIFIKDLTEPQEKGIK